MARWRIQSIRVLFSDPVSARLDAARDRCVDELTAEIPGDRSECTWDPGAAKWKQLEKLNDLIRLREELKRKRRSFWVVPLLLLSGIAIVVGLLTTRVSASEVEIAARSSSIQFETRSLEPITDPIAVDELGVAGALSLSGPDNKPRCRRLELRTSPEGQPTLDAVQVPAGSSVELAVVDATTVRLAITAKNQPVAVSLSYPAGTQLSGCVQRQTTQPEVLRIEGRGGLKFTLHTTGTLAQIRLRSPISVAAFQFAHVQELEEGKPTLSSSLEDGTIYFDELGDTQHRVRSGQLVLFDVVGQGSVDLVQLANGAVTTRLRSTVGNLRVRVGDGFRSLMPTRLSSLMARPDLAILYSAAASLFVLLLSVKKWFEARE